MTVCIISQEWIREVDDCLEVLTQQDGRAILNVSDPDAHNYNAWCKLWTVYGETYTLSRTRMNETGADGRPVYKNVPVADLRRKLLAYRGTSRYLGTTQCVQHRVRKRGCALALRPQSGHSMGTTVLP